MLQSIRDKTSGWIAYLIIGLISIPFALWGINSYLGGGEQQPAAVVNGVEITPRQLDYAYARYRERLASVFGGNLPSAFDDEVILKEQVLTQLIEEQVLLSYVQHQGFRVGDEKLFENIQSMPTFQLDGQFSKELYQNQLASQGYQPALFEQELRQSTEMEQLNQAISSTAFTVPSQIDAFQRLQNQSRKIRTLTIENPVDLMTVSDQEIEEYYSQQAALYMEPAMVKVDYVQLSLDSIKQGIDVIEDQILQRYDQLADQLTTAEIRTASHILLSVKNDASEELVEQTRQKIVDLKTRIDNGESFSTIAMEFSQDPGSATEGGDLGEVERGMMVKPFESVLFALEEGQISDPVKTQFGWHIIKLEKIFGPETPSFDMARVEIEQEIKMELAESRIYDLVENLANIGYEQPDSLLPAADQLELKIKTTDFFSRNKGEGLADDAKFRQAAFSDEVLNQNRNSETIELSDNRVVMMHLNTLQPAKQKPLESVRAELVDTLKKKKGRAQAETDGKKLLGELNQGKTLDDVAQIAGIKLLDIGFTKRTSSTLDSDVLNVAFTMTKPINNPVYEGITEVDGDYTIIELSEVRIDVLAESDEAQVSQKKELKSLTDATANYEYQAMIKSLAEKADIIRTPVAELQ
jgi:peptidyl-prolyl cis-trans isomerase D